MTRPALAGWSLAALAAVMALDLVAVAGDLSWLEWVAKPLLVPLVAAWTLAAAEQPVSRPVRLLVLGLGFAWVGDVALLVEGDTAFLVGLVAFLVMQVLYIAAFRVVPGRGLLRDRPWLTLPYLVIWGGMNVWLHSGVDDLFVPVLVYSAVLTTMAALSLHVAPLLRRPWGACLAVGGALWVVSDAMVAAVAFDAVADTAGSGLLVMSTYVAGQLLVAAGLTLGTAQARLG